MLRLFKAVSLCVLIVSISGCSRPTSKIVGKWQAIMVELFAKQQPYTDTDPDW